MFLFFLKQYLQSIKPSDAIGRAKYTSHGNGILLPNGPFYPMEEVKVIVNFIACNILSVL